MSKYTVKVFEHATGMQITWEYRKYEDAVEHYEELIPKLGKDTTLSIILPNSGLTDQAYSTVERRTMGLF